MSRYTVVWSLSAKEQFKDIIRYIRQDSPQNAETFRKEILVATAALRKEPLSHAPDKLRIDNDEYYRAFEIFRYRITYLIEDDRISIIHIRSTWMEPFLY